MYRLSLIISEIYNKYLPLAEQNGIVLNLDVSDPTKQVSNPEQIKSFLDEQLSSTIQRADRSQVTIGVDKESITITDSDTTLSHAACRLLSNRHIEVTSRVGFGTTAKIFFQPRPITEPTAPAPSEAKIEHIAAGISIDNSAAAPTVQSEAKVTVAQNRRKLNLGAKLKLKGKSKSSRSASAKSKPAITKPTHKSAAKTNRQLSAAAKKADKEVKRIAKKASKQARKAPKTTKSAKKPVKKSTSSAQKSTRRTVKKLKLS